MNIATSSLVKCPGMPQSIGLAGGFFFHILAIKNRFIGDLDIELPSGEEIVRDATAAAAALSLPCINLLSVHIPGIHVASLLSHSCLCRLRGRGGDIVDQHMMNMEGALMGQVM